jgi:DNA-binding MarR family transcriptional regulator/N-acetylglutamate synthase-like GNAT family acetyltransferase
MSTPSAERIAAVRAFNRFYTRTLGLLPPAHLETGLSLAEIRVLYEIAHRDRPTASAVGTELGLDPGYLSRILRRFERAGLITRRRARDDRRRAFLALTRSGRSRFAELDARARRHVADLLAPLGEADQARLEHALGTVQGALGAPPSEGAAEIVLRPPRAGDLGWVVERHGALYGAEYGWNQEFEALVAGLVARFVERFDPDRERCWIAERGGERLGCVFLVRESARVARLRMLLVEPSARGLGLGGRLVAGCTAFARAAGYRKIVLMTNARLLGARRLYEREGYRRTRSEREDAWGDTQVNETWELALGGHERTQRPAAAR